MHYIVESGYFDVEPREYQNKATAINVAKTIEHVWGGGRKTRVIAVDERDGRTIAWPYPTT